ncbi:MAG TPA: hypothetical protein VNB90_06535 [Cytophagaceae bacterium]|nr:hypothetical protein [Cytophagaceae bacterium]
MYHNLKVLVICLLLSLPLAVTGQGTGDSPFSQFGIGDISAGGNVRNMGMGNAGISAGHHYFVNFANPALLPNKKTRRTPRENHTYKYWDYYRNKTIDSTVKLDFAITYQNRSIQAANGYEKSSGMNISYLTFALPLTKTWATALGIQPYSVVNYNLTYTSPVIGDSTISSVNSNSGRGGLYKVFWSHGVGLTENLSVGLESAVVFGNVKTEDNSNIADFNVRYYGFQYQTAYNAISFKPGAHFRREIIKAYYDTIPVKDSLGNIARYDHIRKTKSTGVFYNIGFTCDLNSSMSIRRDLHLYIMDNANRIVMDTSLGVTKYRTTLPPTFKLGFSLDVPLKWTVAADVFYADWSVYHSGFVADALGKSYGINVGGEFAPGQLKLKSRTYRLGFSYVKTPVIYRGYQLDDISISIGGTIPFGRRSLTSPILPRINVALIGGQRGNVNQFGIREQYFKVQFGILINEKWFSKSKIY